MRKFLLLFLFSFPSFAGYVAGSKINQCSRVDYSSPGVCQDSEGEECFKVPNDSGECGIFKLKNLHSGPSVNSESCSGQVECQALLASKVCSVNHDPFINEDFSEVYCKEITGKEMAIDSVLKAQRDAEKASFAQREAQIQGELKKMDCGKRVKAALKIENAKRSLNAAKKKAQADTYKDIAGYLDNGSLDIAQIEINKIVPDGDIVLESDLQAVKSELQNCLQ